MASTRHADVPTKVKVSLPILAKMIDHSLLHPTMSDAIVEEGLKVAKNHKTATACIKPYSIRMAMDHLEGSGVGICPVIGFPQGNSTIAVKAFEAQKACEEIGQSSKIEIDMVVNIGKVLSHDWDYVREEVTTINNVVTKHGAILKVIFENDYLSDPEIVRLCHICTGVGVAFVKTSTGYGFVKRKDGNYNYKGATHHHLKLMRKECGPKVQIKAAGGVRTLDDLIAVMSLGVSRIGATATEAILEEARRRGIGEEVVEVEVPEKVSEEGGYGSWISPSGCSTLALTLGNWNYVRTAM